MKKFASLVGAGALLLGMAGSAFASPCNGGGCKPPKNDGLDIHNFAVVHNSVATVAESGENFLGGLLVFGGSITTGKVTAGSTVYNGINISQLGCKWCTGETDIHNMAFVGNRVFTMGDSGDNLLVGGVVGCNPLIKTGEVGAGTLVDNVVNFTSVGVDLTE